MLNRLARSIRTHAPLVGLWAVIGACYVFVISAGTFTRWHIWSAFYDAHAEALLHGQLYLLEPPSRALLSLRDPYDIANIAYWRWDHILYKGHLYHYWGIVPAFITAAVKAVFRPGGIPDSTLTFAFFMLRLVAGTLLIRDVARNAGRRPPRWMVATGMLVFGLANPTPYTLARAGIYEAAIMGGVAFMVTGLYLGYRALTARRDLAAAAWLAAASLSFGLAGGSRINLLPTVVALTALAGLGRWWQHRRPGGGGARRLFGLGVAALLPAGAVILVLLVINHLRFGDWKDFGHHYAMTYPFFTPSVGFLAPDGWAYLFAPPRIGCRFPFLSAAWDDLRLSVPGWLPLAWPDNHHSTEPTIGLLVASPFAWFAVAVAVVGVARLRLARAVGSAAAPPADAPRRWLPARLATTESWLWLALAIYVAGSAPLFILNVTTMRYQHDFASGLLLIAVFGAWRLFGALRTPRARRALAWVHGALVVTTLVAGLLLGFTGYFKHFERHNPALLSALQQTLSVCRAR